MTSHFTSAPHSHKKKKKQFIALKFAPGAAQALQQATFQPLSPWCKPPSWSLLAPSHCTAMAGTVLHWRAAPHREKKAISLHNKGTGLPAAPGNVTPISGSSGLQAEPFQTGRDTHRTSCPWCCSFLPITARKAGAMRL